MVLHVDAGFPIGRAVVRGQRRIGHREVKIGVAVGQCVDGAVVILCDINAAVLVIQPRDHAVLGAKQLGFPFDVVVKANGACVFVIAEGVIVQARCICIAVVEMRVIGCLVGEPDTLVVSQPVAKTMGQRPSQRFLCGFEVIVI